MVLDMSTGEQYCQNENRQGGNSAENLQGLTFAFLEWRSVKSLNQSGLLAHPPKPTPVSAFRNSPPPVFDLFRFGLLAHAPELE